MIPSKLLGPIMIPDFKILRYHDEIGYYELVCKSEQIEKFRNKFHLDKKEKNLNLNHSSEIYDGAVLSQSFLITDDNRQALPEKFKDLPNGTWMIELTFKREDYANQIVELNLNGFSISATFNVKGVDGKSYEVHEKFRIMNKLSDLLSFNIYVQGGSTDGAGRNEHGAAHFELKEKNTNKGLGKIFMPSLDEWNKLDNKSRIKLMLVHNGADITSKEKKAMVRWLEINDNENLLRCHKEWNENNKFNNRVTLI